MRSRVAIAALLIAGAAAGIAFYAWPAAAKPPKALDIQISPPLQLPVVATVLGDDDPHAFDLARLVPTGSHVSDVWYPQSPRLHRQILVEWIDPHRSYPVGKFGHTAAWGLRLWTETSAVRWQAVDVPILRADGNPGEIHVAFSDVTGDGRADVLFEQYPGTNHGCGPHAVISTSPRGVATRVFSSYLCETTLRGDHGLLALDMPYYLRNDPVCCWSKTEYLRLRWSGSRYETASLAIR